MVEIRLMNGQLVIPEYWIVLNLASASESDYALVVEVLNSKTLLEDDHPVPHFVYLHNRADGDRSFDDEFCRSVDLLIASIYPVFERFLKLEEDFPDYNSFLRENPHAPVIGHFPICERRDGVYYGGKPVYGAMIIRDQKSPGGKIIFSDKDDTTNRVRDVLRMETNMRAAGADSVLDLLFKSACPVIEDLLSVWGVNKKLLLR